MIQKLNSNKHNRSYLGIGLAWILIWVLPWGNLPSVQDRNFLSFLTDMIRLGVALFIFVVPGALLYFLFEREGKPGLHLPGIIPIGFTFSVLLIAAIGLAGRVLGLSFAVVRYTFALVGLVELVCLALLKPGFIVDHNELPKSFHSALQNPPLIFAFILATLLTFHDNLFFIDDTTHLAYLTNWQNSSQLGFQNIIHDGNFIEQSRSWLALYPMGQALLSDLSGLPGLLLLGSYLELFLVPLAVITSYWFGHSLGLSRKAAGFASLIQISLYAWMVGEQFPVGMWFYQNMAEDKVTAAFLLTPVFIFFGLRFLEDSRKINLILLLISGMSLTLTHPAILFFACVVVSGIGMIAFAQKKFEWRGIVQLFLLLFVLLAPYLIIRLAGDPSLTAIPFDGKSAQATYQIERYTHVVNDVFYGLNPEVLKFFDIPPESNIYSVYQYVRLIPIILAIIAGGLAIFKLKKGPLYWYIFTCVLLVLFVTLPYTGWLFGYFVSARLISRASWFSPLGLGSALILLSIKGWLEKRHFFEKFKNFFKLLRLDSTLIGLIACSLFVSPNLGYSILPRLPLYFDKLDHYKQLAQIGAFIDEHTTGPVAVIAVDYADTQLLPGVAAHTILISFREEKEYNGFNYFLSMDEIHERIDASNVIRSIERDIAGERCTYLKYYNLKFVTVSSEFVDQYADRLRECNILFSRVFQTKNQFLLELK